MPLSQRSRVSHSLDHDLPQLRPLPQTYAPLACTDPAQAIPFDMSILTISHKRDMSTVKAIIVGGGIAGLALGIMMDMAGIEFELLERMSGTESPMGGALALGPPVLRLIEQMGLLKEVELVSKSVSGMTIVDGECRKMGRVEGMDKDRYGYPYRIMSRADFHQILMKRVPKSGLHLGKAVIETLQNPNGVSCKCSDGSTYYGDILVGADGAHSLTRERMYLHLKEQGKLPEVDMESSVFEHITLSGISDPLDQRLYPSAHDPTSEFRVIYAKETPCSFWYLPISNNRVAWGIASIRSTPKLKHHVYSRTEANSTAATGSEPNPEKRPIVQRTTSQSNPRHDWTVPAPAFDAHYKELLDARCAMGVGSVRDFLEHTPQERITMIDLEERMYKTWHSGRIVLLGDACHQHLVVGGQGAIQSMLDAVCLVNMLRDIEYTSPEEIAKVFKRYQLKRSTVAKASMEDSSNLDKMFHGQGFMAGVLRKLVFNTVWSFSMKNDKFNNNRPQLSFLPFVHDRGMSKANRQRRSQRTMGADALAV